MAASPLQDLRADGLIPVQSNTEDLSKQSGLLSCDAAEAFARDLFQGPDVKVREIMSEQVKYCFEDDDLDELCANMADIQMRRLPVLNHDKRLVGIVSLGDLAVRHASAQASKALEGISQPGK